MLTLRLKTTIGGSFINDLLPSVGFESTGKRMGAAGARSIHERIHFAGITLDKPIV